MEMKMFQSGDGSPIYGKLRRYWRRNKRYQRLYDVESWENYNKNKKKLKVMYLGGDQKTNKKNWRVRIRMIPKLRVKKMIFSPMMKLFARIRDGYINMMLRLAGNVGPSLTDYTANYSFLAKRIPKAREVVINKSKISTDLDTKLVLEIYTLLMASRREQVVQDDHHQAEYAY